MSFFRRYPTMPSIDELLEIEGVVVIDNVIQGTAPGVGAGVAAIVGEFADVTYGVSISALGVVSTDPQPIEIVGDELVEKVGGWDETLGEFGGDGGSGFLEVRNKFFQRLVAVPVNLAASQGGRLYRELPTNKSATDPTPVVEITGATVPAGTEFKSGANRVRTAQRFTFLGRAEYHRGTDGAVTNAAAAATQTFDSATGAFNTLVRDDGEVGVQVGDILVVGVVGAAGAQGANAGTYRVNAVTDADTVVVEKMDGSNFAWTTGTGMAWRLYTGLVADSGGENAVTAQAGYRIPARPLDATIAINTSCTPTVAADPAAPTATTWAPLTGVRFRSAPVTGFVYVATVMAPNAVNDATLDALYVLAINALNDDNEPANEVVLAWAARKSATIRDTLKAFAAVRKTQGRGCFVNWSPPLDVISTTTILGDPSPGVGAARLRELGYCWPGAKTFVREAVGTRVKLADGTFTTDGQLDTTFDGWVTSVLSCLRPERNPGEVTEITQRCLGGILSYQTGVRTLARDFFKRARARGVMALRLYRSAQQQPVRAIQSNVTTSMLDGERKVNVRRFSFYVQDSLAAIAEPFCKLPLDPVVAGDAVTAQVDFLNQLYEDNRCKKPTVDARSGNKNPNLADNGIFVIKHTVPMIPTADVIVIDSRVGYGVNQVTATSVESDED